MFGAVQDASVQDGAAANTNFGSAAQLLVGQSTTGNTHITFLQFDLSSISSSATINNATLSLFGNLSGNNASFQVDVLQVPGGTFNQSTITYNTAPITGVAITSVLVPNTTPNTYSVDLTKYVQQDVSAGQSQVTIALVGHSVTTEFASFNSTNAGSGAPSLAVSYQ